jgi:hypothetical protein
MPRSYQYMRNWNKGYLHWARAHAMTRWAEPITLHIYSEVLQRFRAAAQGKWPGRKPPERLAQARRDLLRPAALLLRAAGGQLIDKTRFPLNALTQRPMAMYHSWDSQNAWLRQIHSHNYLFVNPKMAIGQGINDGDWIWVESHLGRVKCMCRYSEAVEPGTVWTWNAIGKASGAWAWRRMRTSQPRASCSTTSSVRNCRPTATAATCPTPTRSPARRPGSMRVRISRVEDQAGQVTEPQFAPMKLLPGQTPPQRTKWQAYVAGCSASAKRARCYPSMTRTGHQQLSRNRCRTRTTNSTHLQASGPSSNPGHSFGKTYDPAGPCHRPQRLRRLSRLRDLLQAMEYLRLGRTHGR